jgi:hypothetical protein
MVAAAGPIISAGTAVSNVFPIANVTPYFLLTPAVWTPANISLLISAEGDNFFPMYRGGKLWELACPPGVALLLDTLNWPKGIFMRFVSGTVEHPINQAADRAFKMITA